MMRQMLGDFFARSPVLVYPLIALALFCGVFVAIVVVTWRKDRQEIQRMAQLPLEGEETKPHGKCQAHG